MRYQFSLTKCALIAALAACALAAPGFAGVVFQVIPADGHVVGLAGDTVGWGYSLANEDPGLWLVTSGFSADGFLHGTPNLIFDFPVLSPNSSVVVNYDGLVLAGLFELTWDSDAPLGFLNTGMFRLNAEWWSGDPLNGGGFVNVAGIPDVAYSAEVVAPEPAGRGFAVSWLCALALLSRFCRRCGLIRERVR